MAFVPEVPEESAGEDLRQLYSEIRRGFGVLSHMSLVQGSRPDLLRANYALSRVLDGDGALPPTLKEKIGLVVSAANSASYCIAVHLEILQRLGVDKELGKQLVRDYESALLPEPEKALLRYAEKLTRTPFQIKESDVAELRRHGWDDAAILEACMVTAHFNYLNRIATGLGLVPPNVF